MTRALTTALVLGVGLNAMADFAEDFQAAKRLLDERDYPAAHQAFAKLAASAPNDHGRTWSLSYAAIALGRHEHYDQAIELAQTIGAKPAAAYTQMHIMDTNRRYRDLVTSFSKEDIAAWPDRINYKGLFLRGVAYRAVGGRQAAIENLQQCVGLAGCDNAVKLDALNRAAALWRDLKDDAKAMDTYRRAFAIYDGQPRWKGKWLYPQAVLGATRIAMGQGKYNEAKAMLAKFSVKPAREKRGSWDFLVLETYGDIALAQGKQSDALGEYREAITIKTHKSYTDRVNRKIRELQPARQRIPK